MKHSRADRLLKQILAGDDLADFRRASLEHGLASIRRQRHRQRIIGLCAFASVALLFALGILLNRKPGHPEMQTASSPPPVTHARSPQTQSSDVKFITDEELFALFPNRPMALIGKPGHQQLVFLDNRPRRAASQ